MRTIYYIDGFNLYYRALKGTPYKWLDLNSFCHNIFPNNPPHAIKYFTARLDVRAGDDNAFERQDKYLKALSSCPNVDIIYGHFLSNRVNMPLVSSKGNNKYAFVIKTEEKGSDVNLACHLLLDGFRNNYDKAVVVSNDSDFAHAIELVRTELNKTAIVVCPEKKNVSFELRNVASFVRPIRDWVLERSQFPETVITPTGSIKKPPEWVVDAK